MRQIAAHLPDFEQAFSPYYADGALEIFRRLGLHDFSIIGNTWRTRCADHLREHNLPVDDQGKNGPYDVVFTCADLVIPRNIRSSKIILVQEGMTDPENLAFRLVQRLRFLPRWIASTSTMGLSDAYDAFCVASEGYRDLFIRKGVHPEKLIVTGIPNFDNFKSFLKNDFPHSGYVLVCTSDARETFKRENRRRIIRNATFIAGERQLIFKLHPNEKHDRAIREIESEAPRALVFKNGNTDEMIANCSVLITQYSSTAFAGLALGKEVYSFFDIDELRRLLPLQNASAAHNIAGVCRALTADKPAHFSQPVMAAR
jgi:hypothetical protein